MSDGREGPLDRPQERDERVTIYGHQALTNGPKIDDRAVAAGAPAPALSPAERPPENPPAVAAADPEFPVGGEPTDEEKFYLDWALDTVKGNIARLNELQKNLVTLSIALLGGSLVFYSDSFAISYFRAFAIAALLVGAILSVYGSIPDEYSLDTMSPYQIRLAKEQTFASKKKRYYQSVFFILLGLAFAAVGVLLKHFFPNG